MAAAQNLSKTPTPLLAGPFKPWKLQSLLEWALQRACTNLDQHEFTDPAGRNRPTLSNRLNHQRRCTSYAKLNYGPPAFLDLSALVPVPCLPSGNEMELTPTGEWENIDRRNSLVALHNVAAQVVRNAKILIFTNNNGAASVMAPNSGIDADGVMVIRNQYPKNLKRNGWIYVFGLLACPPSRGVVISGDVAQLEPVVPSLDENPGFDEFMP